MNVLVLNAGSGSLKFEVIAAVANDDALNDQQKLVSGVIENIGEAATFSLLLWRTTTTPFDLFVQNEASRYHVSDADGAPCWRTEFEVCGRS